MLWLVILCLLATVSSRSQYRYTGQVVYLDSMEYFQRVSRSEEEETPK
uniref:SVMP n=1 Tax=Heterorhabditis bacteriophora TaxID=37862 RepID=A0A1I7X0X9_HETBA